MHCRVIEVSIAVAIAVAVVVADAVAAVDTIPEDSMKNQRKNLSSI